MEYEISCFSADKAGVIYDMANPVMEVYEKAGKTADLPLLGKE